MGLATHYTLGFYKKTYPSSYSTVAYAWTYTVHMLVNRVALLRGLVSILPLVCKLIGGASGTSEAWFQIVPTGEVKDAIYPDMMGVLA